MVKKSCPFQTFPQRTLSYRARGRYNENRQRRTVLAAALRRRLDEMGKLLIIAGIFLIVFGLIFTFWGRIPLLGKLPGDFSVQKGNATFFFPLVTSLLLSLILTIVLNVVFRFFK
jgi:hypothetical protein